MKIMAQNMATHVSDRRRVLIARFFLVILSQIRRFKIEMKWVVSNHFIDVKKSGKKSQVFSSLFC